MITSFNQLSRRDLAEPFKEVIIFGVSHGLLWFGGTLLKSVHFLWQTDRQTYFRLHVFTSGYRCLWLVTDSYWWLQVLTGSYRCLWVVMSGNGWLGETLRLKWSQALFTDIHTDSALAWYIDYLDLRHDNHLPQAENTERPPSGQVTHCSHCH